MRTKPQCLDTDIGIESYRVLLEDTLRERMCPHAVTLIGVTNEYLVDTFSLKWMRSCTPARRTRQECRALSLSLGRRLGLERWNAYKSNRLTARQAATMTCSCSEPLSTSRHRDSSRPRTPIDSKRHIPTRSGPHRVLVRLSESRRSVGRVAAPVTFHRNCFP
jgi:hypothetical protein